MNPQFKFLLGDYERIKEDYVDKGKYLGMYFRDVVLKEKHPFYLFSAGMNESLYLNDPALF